VTRQAPRRLDNFVPRTGIWIPVGVIALLFAPIALTSRSFGHDWTLHLWLLRQQQLNIQTMGHPGLFVSAEPLGVFYPIFAFVGSGMYSVGGVIAIVLGDRPILAYKILFLIGLCLAYGGTTWLSVQFGLRGWRSQIAGLVFVTGAYFLTDMLGRGDFGEFIALSSLPYLAAAVCAVLTVPSLRTRHVLAVVLGIFVLTGSHNITLLWGTTFLALIGTLYLAATARRWMVPWKRVGALIGGAAVGAGLNAWYLLPDLAFSFGTAAAKGGQAKAPASGLEPVGMLLNPLRVSYTTGGPFERDIRVTLPWMFAAWACVVAVVYWKRADRTMKTLFVGFFALAGCYLFLVSTSAPWRLLPSIFYNLQFTWRLHAYVLLATALFVMVALRGHAAMHDRVSRAASVVLVVLVVFNVAAATWQVWRVRSEYVKNKTVAYSDDSFVDQVVAARSVVPPSWYSFGQFRDESSRRVATLGRPTLTIPATAVRRDEFSGSLAVPDGPAPFKTNIAAGTHFVSLAGIQAVGRSSDDALVAARAPGSPATGPIRVTIRPAHGVVFVAGNWGSILSLTALLGLLSWPLGRRARGRCRPAVTDS
jgi:hypothetical protein